MRSHTAAALAAAAAAALSGVVMGETEGKTFHFNFTRNGTFFVPSYVVAVDIEMWGAGGKGYAKRDDNEGQVGGGGAWGRVCGAEVAPGTTCKVTVAHKPSDADTAFDCGDTAQLWSVSSGEGADFYNAGAVGQSPDGPWDDMAPGRNNSAGKTFGKFGRGGNVEGDVNGHPGLVRVSYVRVEPWRECLRPER